MTHRLVIIEDHGLLAETVGAALRLDGYEVTVVDAPSTPDPVGRVKELDPDLVLLDLDLGRPATASTSSSRLCGPDRRCSSSAA